MIKIYWRKYGLITEYSFYETKKYLLEIKILSQEINNKRGKVKKLLLGTRKPGDTVWLDNFPVNLEYLEKWCKVILISQEEFINVGKIFDIKLTDEIIKLNIKL